MASVKLNNVSKIYSGNKVPAVVDFNLEIKDKEFVVFVGPSGCGKSTTLRMIAGLEEVSGGEIYIDEKFVNDIEPKDRDIAMVFQNYALYPQKNVYENMAFGLRYKVITETKKDRDGNDILDKYGNKVLIKRRYTKAEIDQKVIEAATILEIKEFLERKPKSLSGGQRQRVAIGRAIVRNPKVFLMDEPLSNLDAKLRNQMRSEILLLRNKIKTTFIYVTHDQVEAMTLGDRIVIMKDGYIQQVGTPIEVFDKPANVFVASFIGSPQMNLVDAMLQFEEGQYFLDAFGKKIKLCEKHQMKLKANNEISKEIILGIRPEFFHLKGEKACSLNGKLIISEMMGTEFYLHVEINNTKLTLKIPMMGLSPENLVMIQKVDNILL